MKKINSPKTSNFDISLEDAIELALIRTRRYETGLSLGDFRYLLLKIQPKRSSLKRKKVMYDTWCRNLLIVNLNNEWIYPFRTYEYQKPWLYKTLEKMAWEKRETGITRLEKIKEKDEPRYRIPKQRLDYVLNKYNTVFLNKEVISFGLPLTSEEVSLYNYDFESLFEIAKFYSVDLKIPLKRYTEIIQEFKKVKKELQRVYTKITSEIYTTIPYILLTTKKIKKLDKELAIIFFSDSFETLKNDIKGLLLFYSFSGSPLEGKWLRSEVFEWDVKNKEKINCRINPDEKLIDDFKTFFYPEKTKKEIKKMLNDYIIGNEASSIMWRSKTLDILPILASGTIVIRSTSLLEQLQEKSLSGENINRLTNLTNQQKKKIFDGIDLNDVLPQINNCNVITDRNQFIKDLIDIMKNYTQNNY